MKKFYFLSDMHLGNRYLSKEAGRAVEKKLAQWLDNIKNDAAAVYFLGDLFDYWYEYRYVAPRGHVRFLGKLAELADSGVEIHLLTGNHDIWMFDYLPQETGAVIHRQPFTVELAGHKFFVGHGDEASERPLGYRIVQRIFRNRLCQRLYSAIHPRWTFGFARRWSLSSRKNGLEADKFAKTQARCLQALTDFAESYLLTHPDVSFFIFGHLHIVADNKLANGSRLLVAGDWMQLFSYIEWDGKTLEIKYA